ncbi:hypothetical protein SAMN05444366_1549 [Flavobacterium saccharophilum]|uniref:Uncharacterized protein n=1 Tax=Flavobacterium saccharophilum TaxID=29534 RepID=A0A1M7DHE3_9FLAO|nr:hypothetical protein SAMN05444366_1549 [Flavobacterium saccharophilum]
MQKNKKLNLFFTSIPFTKKLSAINSDKKNRTLSLHYKKVFYNGNKVLTRI